MSGVYSAWQAWRGGNALPVSGGWQDQPLTLLVKFEVYDVVYSTWRDYRDKNYDRGKFTPFQRQLINWLEND